MRWIKEQTPHLRLKSSTQAIKSRVKLPDCFSPLTGQAAWAGWITMKSSKSLDAADVASYCKATTTNCSVRWLSKSLHRNSPARKRFLREARAAAAVTHQNVVRIYAVGEQPCPYLVMEYVAGGNLQQRLDLSGPFTVDEVTRWGLQIIKGLAASHAQGVIHRDIKPANILLESDTNEIKITDFGLARTVDDSSLTQSGMITGTPLYMSPEQAQGMSVDHRSDLFSFGSVLYALCSGRPPFRATTTLSILQRIVEQEPRPLHEIIPEVPSWLASIIRRLHAKNPNNRFQSAQEVKDAWELALCQGGTETVDSERIQPLVGGKIFIMPQSTKLQRTSKVGFWAFVGASAVVIIGLSIVLFNSQAGFNGNRSKSKVTNSASPQTNTAPEALTPPAGYNTGSQLAIDSVGGDFKEIRGASKQQIQAWAAGLPASYLPTWIAPRRFSEPIVFDAVALDLGRHVKHIIQFIDDDWAEDVGEQYKQLEASGYRTMLRSIYGDSTVMIWTDSSYVEDSSYWWGTQSFVNEKALDGLKYEKQVGGVSHRWMPVSLNVSHREEPYYDAIFHWQPYVDSVWYWSLTPEGLQDRVNYHRDRGWRLHRISMHEKSESALFTAVFVVGETAEPWKFEIFANDREYEQTIAANRLQGKHPQCLLSWVEDYEARYAVLWSR
ncbi:MAG TPA: hypothetical protein DDZ51_22555 [Planctomycetaceae bacterium]|nr:hypothetical protein [Planctomycetaceae bacterium]